MLLGFALGLKHATDADHVVAVSTMLSEERRWLRSCWIGLFWGIGHTASLMVAGLLVVLLKTPISESTALWLETGVALMLVVLGVRVLIRSFHKHEHAHPDAGSHVHWHMHLDSRKALSHSGWTHFAWRPVLVGLVHGAAGSAALTLLVLSTISSTLTAIVYILIFGLGSILGMMAISALIALPLSLAGRRLSSVIHSLQIASAVASCAFGIYLGVHLWLV